MGRLLIYVEDPGAANFVMPVLPVLTGAGWQVSLYANGLALPYLADRGCKAIALMDETSVDGLFDELVPDIVMIGTSETLDSRAFEFTSVAAKSGIVSIAVIDGPANVDSRFRGQSDAPLHHAPNWLFLTDMWTKDRYAAIGFPSERMVVTGHPYYDLIRQESIQLRKKGNAFYRQEYFPEAIEGQKIVAFLSETSQGLGIERKRRTADYSLNGWGGSDLRTHIVMEEFLDAMAALDERPYLVLRLHPKDSHETYQEQCSHFDAVSRGGRALPQLFATDLVVGLSTSLLVEAEIAGLNTASILPREAERDLIASVRDGHTPYATTPDDVKQLLQVQLARSAQDNGDGKMSDSQIAVSSVVKALEQLN